MITLWSVINHINIDHDVPLPDWWAVVGEFCVGVRHCFCSAFAGKEVALITWYQEDEIYPLGPNNGGRLIRARMHDD